MKTCGVYIQLFMDAPLTKHDPRESRIMREIRLSKELETGRTTLREHFFLPKPLALHEAAKAGTASGALGCGYQRARSIFSILGPRKDMEAANPSVFGIQMWCLVRLVYPDVMTEFFHLDRVSEWLCWKDSNGSVLWCCFPRQTMHWFI